jgi:hypothetical protein
MFFFQFIVYIYIMDIDFAFQQIDGLHRGLYTGQHERLDEINERVQQRHFSDQPLQANFDPRPIPTKYSMFPIINRRAPSEIQIQPVQPHVVENNFNPATRKYPYQTYLANLDTETMLRNQSVALQRNMDTGTYIPASSSELYLPSVPQGSVGTGQHNHPDLFVKREYTTHIPEVVSNTPIGKSQFFNHTRFQLRGLGSDM